MELTADQRAELQATVRSADTPATIATRARIVLWHAEGQPKKQIAKLAGVSRPTVDHWLHRYHAEGIAGLFDRSHAAPREQVPAGIRSRILAATRMSKHSRGRPDDRLQGGTEAVSEACHGRREVVSGRRVVLI
jgi:DNA-binding CsgD family transcriptional regulator